MVADDPGIIASPPVSRQGSARAFAADKPSCQVTGLELEGCRATLASTQEEGVGVVAMDASRDALFVGDSAGYIHVLRLALCAKGVLQPLVQLERIPPAGEALAHRVTHVVEPQGQDFRCTWAEFRGPDNTASKRSHHAT